jgi:hypothetical protein
LFPVESARSRHSSNHHLAIVGAAIIRAIRRTRLEARQKALKEAVHEIRHFLARAPGSIRKRYEAAHDRVLQIFNKDYKMPASFMIHQFMVRVGDYGGYMIVETDNPTDIHYVTSIFAVFEFSDSPPPHASLADHFPSRQVP